MYCVIRLMWHWDLAITNIDYRVNEVGETWHVCMVYILRLGRPAKFTTSTSEETPDSTFDDAAASSLRWQIGSDLTA